MSKRFGPSRAEEAYDEAMHKAKLAREENSPVETREWLEAAEVAKRLIDRELLRALGRSGEGLC